MLSTRALRAQYQPLIRFLGRRKQSPPEQAESPQPHPASPSNSLPQSFASYRQKAVQHGPLGPQNTETNSHAPPPGGQISYGAQGHGRSGHSLGSIQPDKGQYFDLSELPRRFHKTSWSPEEIDAIESGGASLF